MIVYQLELCKVPEKENGFQEQLIGVWVVFVVCNKLLSSCISTLGSPLFVSYGSVGLVYI